MLKAFKNILWVILFVSLFLISLTIFFLTTAHTGAATLVGALLGIWLAWRLNLKSADKRRQDEYRSLLASFAHELVEAFHRCVLYYKQRELENRISFSALFDFNDASTLSRLASVTDSPKIVDTIMYLKKIYFQVGRHVENASRLATEQEIVAMSLPKTIIPNSKMAKNQLQRLVEANNLWNEASLAQGRALAFFLGSQSDKVTYQKIVDCTTQLVNELKGKWPSEVSKELDTTFVKAKKLKSRIDCVIKKRKAEKLLTKTLTKHHQRTKRG